MNNKEKCNNCNNTEELKRGWDNAKYCSYQCERQGLLRLHSSMPMAGVCKRLPAHISKELSDRWD